MGKPYRTPELPPLPKVHVGEATPFAITGVDFTGALYVKESDGEHKAYICLLTYASTRAVHLEVVSDLSTDTPFHLSCYLSMLPLTSLSQRN